MSDEAKNELNKTIEIEKSADRENLVYKNFQTIGTFGKDIYNGKIT